MGIKVELDFDAADALLVAVLKDSIRMHEKGNKKLKRKPDEDEQRYLEAAKVVIDWFSVKTGWGI